VTGDENEDDLALEQVKDAEGEVQVELTVGGKRIIRKRKLAEHEDVTVGALFIVGHLSEYFAFTHSLQKSSNVVSACESIVVSNFLKPILVAVKFLIR
jgi:hypothetical protein